MEKYFKARENREKRLNLYIDKLNNLDIDDLEELLIKIYNKNNNTIRNGIKIYNPIINIEDVVVKFIEKFGKDISYEYNVHRAEEDEYVSYDNHDVCASLIKTNKSYWVSAYIMGKTWFEPFKFNELDINLCKCNKCNKGLLYSESFCLYDYNNKGEHPKIYIYCKEHYENIKNIL